MWRIAEFTSNRRRRFAAVHRSTIHGNKIAVANEVRLARRATGRLWAANFPGAMASSPINVDRAGVYVATAAGLHCRSKTRLSVGSFRPQRHRGSASSPTQFNQMIDRFGPTREDDVQLSPCIQRCIPGIVDSFYPLSALSDAKFHWIGSYARRIQGLVARSFSRGRAEAINHLVDCVGDDAELVLCGRMNQTVAGAFWIDNVNRAAVGHVNAQHDST